MGEPGRGRLRKPAVYANRPLRQLPVAAWSSLFSLLALSFLEPLFYPPCVFENALTPFGGEGHRFLWSRHVKTLSNEFFGMRLLKNGLVRRVARHVAGITKS